MLPYEHQEASDSDVETPGTNDSVIIRNGTEAKLAEMARMREEIKTLIISPDKHSLKD